ncbi:unnamed protein product [Lactuca saligna]|uniref:Transcription initiation factor IIF subunit alpha n=1 Tax=Lactuca saligna TaxID=75948 RepID=A0AA35YYF2_LACSI|nr:unnamed protein product [Lactuca saligna]
MGENLLHPSVANCVFELLLSSHTIVALVVNFVINIFILIILSLKCVIVHLSLGGEVLWAGQHRKSSLGYAARYNIDNMVASGQIASTELLLLAIHAGCLLLVGPFHDYWLIEKRFDMFKYDLSSMLNFNKVAQYKKLTLEEAEEKIKKNRRKTADGYEIWMMKAANNGATAFGEVERPDDKEGGGGRGRKKNNANDDEGNVSDRGEENEDEEFARKN